MELTIGFITLFFVIIIPGLLFRRFFYYGEFSKQFNSKETVYQSIFYSIIPGIFLQLFGALCYFTFRNSNVSFSSIHLILTDILGGSKNLDLLTKRFLDSDLHLFLMYNLIVYCLAILIGFLISRLIRYLKLDIKYKVFRFKNQWYYIFRGEILLMKKFKSSSNLIGNYYGITGKTSATFADILIENPMGNRELYSGFVVDYDLNNDDISLLDKIYLLDARRYKKDKGETTTKKIPGEVFILRANQILNINLTYIPDTEEKKKKKSHDNKQIIYKLIFVFITIIQLLLTSFFIINRKTSYDLFKVFFDGMLEISDFNFNYRIFFAICLVQLLSLFSPVKRELKFTYKLNYILAKFIVAVILVFLFWLSII